MQLAPQAHETERRKLVRLRLRPDLSITPQRYEGKTFYVVKDPVALRYYRFKEQEYFLLALMDGEHTTEQLRKEFEKRFRPDRLTLEDLEHFVQQLLQAGLVQNESPQAGKQLFKHRQKRLRTEWMQTLTNLLYIKLPVFDPEKVLTRMLPPLRWIFTRTFFVLSLLFMLSAVALVATHFDTFYSRLPAYHEFFSFKTAIYLWIALGVVKVIHEFGHGLSCKAFGGEVHEMGFLLLCLSPAMYCNVSDAWTLPNKWHRIIISFAGIYVELMIAAAATFIWWNTPGYPFLNYLSLSLMVVCSVSTVVFNGNPLMRYDGYYVLADWIEIPNLRDRANRYLNNLAQEFCLGIEVPPEPYMETSRKVLFITFAVVSYVYRWVITFVILKFMATFLKPYNLEVISSLFAVGALASMIGWPMWRLFRNVQKRGRLPDMKPARVTSTAVAVTFLLLFVFLVPIPVTRVRDTGVVQILPTDLIQVHIEVPGQLDELYVSEGQVVRKGHVLAKLSNYELESKRDQALALIEIKQKLMEVYSTQLSGETDARERSRVRELHARAQAELKQAQTSFKQVSFELSRLILRAPRDGAVIGLPQIDEVGKRFDKDQMLPFCSVGDRTKLRVLLPVATADYNLIKENKARLRTQPLTATIRVQGRVSRTWTGHVEHLPESEAKEIPLGLSNKGGGPLAVKPQNNPNILVPQSQVFLVGVNFDQPDDTIAIGSLSQVKIHCEYRSLAWFAWRSINSIFELRLGVG